MLNALGFVFVIAGPITGAWLMWRHLSRAIYGIDSMPSDDWPIR